MMHVVIRVPWKRPTNFVSDLNSLPKSDLESSQSFWTPERDAELWKLLALNPPDQVDWDSVAQKMNITPEECFDRSTFLYRQQIEKIQQQMFQKKRQSLLMNQSITSVNTNSQIDPVNTNKSMTTSTVKPSAGRSGSDSFREPLNKVQHLPKIPRDALNQLVTRFDFDWVKVGAELNLDPETCRKVFNYYERQDTKNQRRNASKLNASGSTATNPPALYLDPNQLLNSMRAGYSPGPSRPITPHLKALETIPAFVLTESTGSLATNVNRTTAQQGEAESNNSSNSGSFLSNDSISKSALESAYLHMEHSGDSD